jgi:protein TonB
MEPGYYPSGGVGKDPSGKAFAGSLITHGVVIALVLTSGLFNLTKNNFGSPAVSSGAVGVDIVKSIPIPRRDAPVNPLANDSQSIVPQAPAMKVVKPVKVQPEKAIPIPEKVEKPKKLTVRQLETMYKPEHYKSNQVYSNTPQAASSPLYGMKGSNGIDLGSASVLGDRFGAYVDLMRDRISQHWNTASVHSSPSQRCQISFTIARNGTVSNVQVSQPSGDYLLDTSAKRAVMDATPLPPLPPQFERNEATVDLWFQIRQ